MTHPYKDILIAIANGEQIQIKDFDGGWLDDSDVHILHEIAEEEHPPHRYRIKPKTIRIGEFDVPEPIYEGFINDHKYYYPVVFDEEVSHFRWIGRTEQEEYVRLGLLHATEEAAQIHLDALLSFTRRSA